MAQYFNVLRKEKKYVISLQTTYQQLHLLKQVLHEDNHNGDEGYLVRSLYFDTINNTDYKAKEDGLLNRKKIRLRIYSLEDEYVKLEMKEKFSDNQRKRSLLITRESAKRLIQCDYNVLLEYEDDKFAEELYLEMSTNIYVPKCIVEYNRRAFIVPENDIRITFDSDIRATEIDFDIFSSELSLYPVGHPDDVTMEVKYNHFIFSYVKDLLDNCKKTQTSNSKYCRARSVSLVNMSIF